MKNNSKRFNRIMFLWSIAMVGSALGMEKEISVRENECFVQLEDKEVQRRAESSICYYKGYCVQKDDKGNLFFPVKCLDFIPIESLGEERFFVTSSMKPKIGALGCAHIIHNKEVTRLAVVTGVAEQHNCRVKVYIGFNTDKNVEPCSCSNKVYPAWVMVFLTKEKFGWNRQFPYHIHTMFDQVGHMWETDVKSIVKKHMLTSRDDCEWDNPLFQAKVKELFGKRAEEVDFKVKAFIPRVTYCTEKENKFKDTH